MRIQSPLSNLRDVLTQVRASANNYRATLFNNEAATRAVLIDPVLRALGWDTGNTFMVEVEKTIGNVRADYALYDSNGNVAAVVEAKKLGENLNQYQTDITKYAYSFGVGNVFLTDGLIWRHYTKFDPQHFAPSQIHDLANDNLGDVTSYFVQVLDAAKLWPDDGGVDVLAQQLAQLQSDFISLQQQVSSVRLSALQHNDFRTEPVSVPARMVEQPPQHNLAVDDNEHSYIPLKTMVDASGKSVMDLTGKSPSQYRMSDGQEISVKQWKQILIETCKQVLASNSIIPLPYPDRSGKRINLFGVVQPPKGIANVAIPYADSTVYVHTNYDANNCVANAFHALKLLPEAMKVTDPAVRYTLNNNGSA